MKNINFKATFKQLQNIPHYLANTNVLTREAAEKLCKHFGTELSSYEADFKYANECGQRKMDRADTAGNGMGMYHNAERLFFGYLYEECRVGACESAEASRNERDYD